MTIISLTNIFEVESAKDAWEKQLLEIEKNAEKRRQHESKQVFDNYLAHMSFFAYEVLGTGAREGLRAKTKNETLAALRYTALPARSIGHHTSVNEMLQYVSLIPLAFGNSAYTPLIRAELLAVLITFLNPVMYLT
jgi:hypothetical protein